LKDRDDASHPVLFLFEFHIGLNVSYLIARVLDYAYNHAQGENRMNKPRETLRMQNIDFRLRDLRERETKVRRLWMQINGQRLKLENEIRELSLEKDALSQGQLLFDRVS
jgi:hypothetical protein